MSDISCIIAAYNEDPRIAAVLKVVAHHPLLTEIIVVDDGSTDKTRRVVTSFAGVRLIALPENGGKSKAVAAGIREAKGEFIFLLDADLIGLTARDVTELLQPVLTGQAQIAISMRKNSPWIDRVIGIDYISGERVFPRSLVHNRLTEIAALPRFGLEVFLNRIIIKERRSIKIVFWKNVISQTKLAKTGAWMGIKNNIRMVQDILTTISAPEVVYQFIALTRLKV